MMHGIDLNCDLGELPGPAGLASDEQLLAVISSANIACGGHAGDEARIRRTVALALQHGVAIGAHPSFEDREHFGRCPLALPREEIAALVERQSRLVLHAANAVGSRLQHVKPHGALYNLAAVDAVVAAGIVDGVLRLGPGIVLVGLAGSRLIAEARNRHVPCWQEFFADRQYRSDGTLVPRTEPQAVLVDEELVAERVIRAILTGKVRSVADVDIAIHIDTVCIHGDSPGAPQIAEKLRVRLSQAGIQIRTPESNHEKHERGK